VQRGWIRLYRRIQDHDLWKEKPFTRGQAWIDIILHTNHDTCTVQLPQKYWAKRWGWSRQQVERFFHYLRVETMVEIIESGQLKNRVSGASKQASKLYVCNYYNFQQPASKSASKSSESNTIINTNNTLKEQIYIVGNFWNSKKIIHHGPKTIENCMATLKRHLLAPYGTGDYWTDDICNAICNYERVLNGKEYFWTHRWTLKEFLQRGLDRFMDEAKPLDNFLKKDKEKLVVKEKGRYDYPICLNCGTQTNAVKIGKPCPWCDEIVTDAEEIPF